MSAYRISTHRLYRKSLLMIASDPAVQKEVNAEARCNPLSDNADRRSDLRAKTTRVGVRVFGAEQLEQRGEMKPPNETELRQLRYRVDVVRTWPASERRDVTLAGIYYRLMILEMQRPK